MRRSFSYLDQVLVSFFFVFVFSVIILINIKIKGEVNVLKNNAISALEQRLNVKINYDDFYFSSWNEVTISGLTLQESGYKQDNVLVEADTVEVSVRLSDLLFRKLDNLKFLKSISISDFKINFFANSSIVQSLGLAMNNNIERFSFKKSEGDGISLSFDQLKLACKNGKLNYYTQDRQDLNLPLASLSVNDIDFFLDKTEGVFKLNGRSEIFRSLNGFSANFGLDGIINFKEKTADIGVVLDKIYLLGESAPDIRFLIDYRDKKLSIDSGIFSQLLYLSGSYRSGGRGAFSIKINRDSKFFMNFLENRGALKSIFDVGVQYVFAGKIDLELLNNDFKLVGSMSVKDSKKSVVDLSVLANSSYLDIQKVRLAGNKTLLLGKGRWLFKRRLPDLQLSLVNFSVDNRSVSGNFNLQYRSDEKYFIVVKNAVYNQVILGSLSSSLIFDEDGMRFDSRSYNRYVNFKGFLDNENDIHLELVLNGFYLSPVAKLAKIEFLKGAVLSGKMHLNIMDNEIESEGALRGFNFFGSGKRLQLNYLYSGNNLKIKKAFLSSPALSFKGDVVIGPEKVSAKLNLLVAGINYPLQGYLKFDKSSYLNLNIRNWFSLSGSLDGASPFVASFKGLPVVTEGLKLNLYGQVRLGFNGLSVDARGDLLAIFSGNFKNYLKQARISFRSQGPRFNFKNISLEFPNRKIEGFGNFILGQNDVRFNFSFDKSIDLYLKYSRGRVLSKIMFNKFKVNQLLESDLQGSLLGSLELSGVLPDLDVSGDLKLVDGFWNKKKFGFGLNLKSIKNGFAINKGEFYLGGNKFSVANGFIRLKQGQVDSVSLKGALSLSSLVKITSSYSLQGKGSLDDFSGTMQYRNLNINGNKLGQLRSKLILNKSVLHFDRDGNSGITGFFNFKKSIFDIYFYDNNIERLYGTGSLAKNNLEIYFKSNNLSLSYLTLMSGVFSKAKGSGKMSLTVKGSLDAPQLDGYVKFKNGYLKLPILQKEIKKLQLELKFAGNKINLVEFSGKVGDGSINAKGSSFFRRGSVEDLNIRFRTDRKEGIKVDFDAGDLKAKGKVFADVVIKGSIAMPSIIGRVAVKDNDISYMEDSSPSKDTYLKHINWHLDITAMTGVRYYYTVVNVVLKPGTGIKLRGRIWDPDFRVKGKIEIERGTFDYINHEFKVVSPTYVDFRKSPRGFDALLNFLGKSTIKDSQGNDVIVYIQYSGILGIDDLNPTFYSEPSFSESELQQMLGIKLESDGGDNKEQENIVLESTDLISMLGLSTLLSKRVKSFLGLDVFTIRTSILRHLIEKDSLDNLDPEREMSVLRGTEFTIGKYLTSFIFIEYTLSLQSAASIVSELIPAHKFGIDLSFNLLNVGYKFKSTEESDFSAYEHSIEVNFRKKF